jgi:hypothetical protein
MSWRKNCGEHVVVRILALTITAFEPGSCSSSRTYILHGNLLGDDVPRLLNFSASSSRPLFA